MGEALLQSSRNYATNTNTAKRASHNRQLFTKLAVIFKIESEIGCSPEELCQVTQDKIDQEKGIIRQEELEQKIKSKIENSAKTTEF